MDKKKWGGTRKNSGRHKIGDEVRVKVSFTLEPALKAKLEAMAKEKGLSRSDLVNSLIRDIGNNEINT